MEIIIALIVGAIELACARRKIPVTAFFSLESNVLLTRRGRAP